MKRLPGLWILLSAGVLCLSLQNVYGLKATELIFGKTTTTTTTTTEASAAGESVTDLSQTGETTTKSNLTGNPQIDYIYDPNLPRELNGYNLSSYPFYNSMPKDIDFKCDGLHDGFYASVPHKCQVYHHCLFGTRYDFLCANYTAFDQTTFICHFVSEVDCVNSHKFWHRNDALYQTASTTTTPKPTPISVSPALTARRPSPAVRRRRPSRRRPQYEYYDDDYEDDVQDDYYEDLPRRRRKRPRPRPRPVYDDYDYDDDRYERRGSTRRNENRRDSEDQYDRRKEVHDRREYDDRRRYKDDRRRDSEDRVRYEKDDESTYRNDRDRMKTEDRKRKPIEDEEDNPRYYENRRPVDDKRYDRPKTNRKPYSDEDEYDDDKRSTDRVRNPSGIDNGQSIVKPHGSSSIYNQPRMAPRIRPPIPKNEQNKFTFKSSTELPQSKKSNKDEKYDDYDDDLPPARPVARPKLESDLRSDRKPDKSNSERDDKRSFRRPSIFESRNKPKRPVDDFYEDEERPTQSKPRSKPDNYARDRPISNRNRGKDSAADEYERKGSNSRKEPKLKVESAEDLPIATTTKEPVREYPDAVRVIKRPFLPSRGGNPYSNRGLQPVGAKALDIAQYDTEITSEDFEQKQTKPLRYSENESNVQNTKRFPGESKSNQAFDDLDDEYTASSGKVKQQSKEEDSESTQNQNNFKPSPALEQVVNRLKASAVITENTENFKTLNPVPTRTILNSKNGEDYSRSPEKSSMSARNPLDINESEYDVTLNDALNPTIPNLPIRNFPTGFSATNDYSYDTYTRPRYDVNYNRHQENRFQTRAPSQRIETVVDPYINQGERKYVALPAGPIYNNFRPSPQITQAQTHGFYSVV